MRHSFGLLAALLCCTFLAFGQSPLWRSAAEPQGANRQIVPAKYRTLQLDEEEMQSFLSDAPNSRTEAIGNSTLILEIPTPEGQMIAFRIAERSVMNDALQAQFPEIRTYVGEALNTELAFSARFDFTLRGFHGQVFTPSGTFFIDPYAFGITNTYIVYWRSDFYANTSKQMATCDPLGGDISHPDGNQNRLKIDRRRKDGPSRMTLPAEAKAANGTQLRTYQLALACTGEYASFHGGTIPLVMSAFITSMNRVNGVFERDLSLEMIMVANNSDVIFLNAGTDPYTNSDVSAMLSQNQTTCDLEIGSSNYDIGHVFGTGGGGVAFLQSVCNSNIKAGGVTGGSSPVGDPFDIDYVAHEMGHQWGGNHTQNNPCNRAASAAYEPGSASTIMGYAGICAPNLQNNSNDYFHNRSYNEMRTFSVTGGGNSCATTSPTGNNPPVVTVPSGGFTIPISTPFELTATATDPNGNTLTYCWEQYNLGPATDGADNNLTNPSGNAPIFRSWLPTSSPTRIFPRLSNLLNNTTVIGERLPTYTRDLTFRCTVRDNAAIGGGVGDAQVAFQVTSNSGPFVVTAPNTNVNWAGNSNQTITWLVANTTVAPVSCANVDIFLSTDGGQTFPFTLANAVANDGSQSVVIPNISTTQARIKVKAANNIFFDISNSNFTITAAPVFARDIAIQSILQPQGDVCGNTVSPQIAVINLGSQTITTFTIAYSISGGAINSFVYNGSLATNASTTINLPAVAVNPGAQEISVILQNPNGLADQDFFNNAAFASFTVTSVESVGLPMTNNFSGSFPGTGWEINNPDALTTWASSNNIQSNCVNGSVARIELFTYNSTGQIDDLVSPWTNLTSAAAPELTFDYAYARYSSTFFDRMQVQIIRECESDWTTLWDRANLVLATAGSTTSSYTPTCAQWSAQTIDLTAYSGDAVRVRFRVINGYGNNLYLDNISIAETAPLDCAGVPNGASTLDACGVCDANPANNNQTCADCAGVPNGNSTLDACGVCDANPANDNQTCADCAGVPNGSSTLDACGVCDANPANNNQTCADCAGVPNGNSALDACGVCDANPANDNQTCADCAGVPNGNSALDACGVCDSNPANDNQTCADCAGVPNGNSTLDACGVCDANPANDNQTCADCAGMPNGSSTLDACGVCDSNPANDNQTCADCAGVPNGNSTLDACGVCDANPANDNQTCADCAGVPNGSALLDACGICTGGNTGVVPCAPSIAISLTWNPNCGERPITLRAYEPGTENVIGTFTGMLTTSGTANIATTLAGGNYDLYVRINGSLSKAFLNVLVSPLSANSLTLNSLSRGDINLNDRINLTDVSVLSAAFGAPLGTVGYNILADLNCDGQVNLVDVSILAGSFGMIGADPAAGN